MLEFFKVKCLEKLNLDSKKVIIVALCLAFNVVFANEYKRGGGGIPRF